MRKALPSRKASIPAAAGLKTEEVVIDPNAVPVEAPVVTATEAETLTDLLSRGFATRCSAVDHLGGLALLALDLSPSLRAPLARHLLQGLRF